MIRYVFYCRFDTTTSSLSIYQRLRCFEVVTENYQEKQNVSDISKVDKNNFHKNVNRTPPLMEIRKSGVFSGVQFVLDLKNICS